MFQKKKSACCEYIETVDDVLENLFLDFVTCSRKHRSTFAMCVSGSCVIVTRLALHMIVIMRIMSFEIALSLDNVIGSLKIFLPLLVVVLWK